MSVADGMRKMLSLGISMDEALAIAEAFEIPAADARKERNRRYYERHKDTKSGVLNRLNSDADGSAAKRLKASENRLNQAADHRAHVEDKLLFQEIEPQEVKKEGKKDARDDFETRFWPAYPNKVGKADASKAFVKAISKIQIEPMLEALDRYVHKTDDRPWCNPATWLNQERWTDQPAEAARAGPSRGGGGPRGLEWFDEAARWIDENEQRRTETGNRRDQNAVGRAPQLAIVHRS